MSDLTSCALTRAHTHLPPLVDMRLLVAGVGTLLVCLLCTLLTLEVVRRLLSLTAALLEAAPATWKHIYTVSNHSLIVTHDSLKSCQ